MPRKPLTSIIQDQPATARPMDATEVFEIFDHDKETITPIYSLTLTLKPELYKLPVRRQVRATFELIKELLEIYCSRFVLVAELTRAVNVHFHCLVQFSSLMEFAQEKFLDALKYSKSLGNPYLNPNEIVDVTSFVRAYNYITKEYIKTFKVINDCRKTLVEIMHHHFYGSICEQLKKTENSLIKKNSLDNNID